MARQSKGSGNHMLPANTLMLSIDGGTEMGVAAWRIAGVKLGKVPERVKVIRPTASPKWLKRGLNSGRMLVRFIRELEQEGWDVKKIYCEEPAFMGTAGGRTSARSGALVKLSIQVGRVAQIADEWGASFHLVAVQDWKGNMSKAKTVERIQRVMGPAWKQVLSNPNKKSEPDHDWDAVGIGLHVKGYSLG